MLSKCSQILKICRYYGQWIFLGKDEVTGSNPVISSKKRPVTVVVAGLFRVFYNFSISPKMTKNRAKNERKTLNCSQIAVKSEWGHIVRICCHIISRLGDYLTTAW